MRTLPQLRRATDAVLPFLPGKALDRQVVERQPHPNPAFGWDETYTLPENLYLAADRGAGERFRTMARQYLLDGAYFDPLAAARNGFGFILDQSFVTGGWGPNEGFVEPGSGGSATTSARSTPASRRHAAATAISRWRAT
jgi:hypothetical protein